MMHNIFCFFSEIVFLKFFHHVTFGSPCIFAERSLKAHENVTTIKNGRKCFFHVPQTCPSAHSFPLNRRYNFDISSKLAHYTEMRALCVFGAHIQAVEPSPPKKKGRYVVEFPR